MAKYHIRENGEPGVCTAKDGNCPFGADAPHFASSAEARSAYEAQQTSIPEGASRERLYTQTELNLKAAVVKQNENLRRVYDNLLATGYLPRDPSAFTHYVEVMESIADKAVTELERMDQHSQLFSPLEKREAEAFHYTVYVNIKAAELRHYRKYVKQGKGFLGLNKGYYDHSERFFEKALEDALLNEGPAWISEETRRKTLNDILTDK